MKQVDLIRACRRLIRDVPIALQFEFIDGHQTELRSDRPLTIMERLNDHMNRLAKLYLRYLSTRRELLLDFSRFSFYEDICLYTGDHKITGPPSSSLSLWLYAPLMQTCLDSINLLSAISWSTGTRWVWLWILYLLSSGSAKPNTSVAITPLASKWLAGDSGAMIPVPAARVSPKPPGTFLSVRAA